MSTPSGIAIGSGKYSIHLLLAFIAAGLAGNHFNFEIFLNINFLFGSIFAMLALQFLGFGRGIIAAGTIAAYTYVTWNHPYAIIIMTAEVATVGWLMTRRKMGMVLADTLYWLIIGMPLVYLFYHIVMNVPPSNTYIVMTKQAVNGIANALVARLLFTGYLLRSRSSTISYKEIICNLLVFFLLFPVLALLARESRKDFTDTDLHIRSTLTQHSQITVQRLDTWVVNRKSAVLTLAEMAATQSPQQMQTPLEQAKKSDISFERIGQLDSEATITAYFPLLDELGQTNIGKNFADRPFIPQLKQTLKPMLSEVVMGKIGIPRPLVSILAPVVTGGEYGGYIAGVLNLNQIQEYLDSGTKESATLYTLVDKNNNVIMTNRGDQTVMKPFLRGKGSLTPLDNNISQWIPPLSANIPISERWKKSYYVAENSIGDPAEWKLILELPVAPFQKMLYEQYTVNLFTLFLLLLAALALSEYSSRALVMTMGQLTDLTYELPVKLATAGKDLVWPESNFKEGSHLINNFREMADSLTDQFREVKHINQTLEQRVEERTKLLEESDGMLRLINEEFKVNEEELRVQIDEYEVVQTQLQAAKAVADSANTAKSQFLANMSHEIRTPMNGVLGMIQLLEMTDLTDEQLEYASALKLSANNLMSLINDILDLSKIEAGKIELESSEFSLSHCINDVVLMQKSVISGKGLKLDLIFAEKIPHILIGDQLRIKQILLNLLGNAVKFTAQGSISLSTQLLEHNDESVVVQIVIRDSGIGIPPEALDRIFKPFTQADGSTTRRFGGTGLGLTISRRLVELMGGSIAVESAQGVGSCFTVTLPLSIGTGIIAARDDVYKSTIDRDGPALRILYVEDDPTNITFGTTLLKKLGHNSIVAVNGRECLAALEKGVFDLVLMDIQMPVMNGEDALMEIRRKERENGAHLPVIAVTAHSMRGDKERYLELGFDGYISKPLTASELAGEMRRVRREVK